MEIVHSHCAGLDVHKKTLVACAMTPEPKGGWHREIQSFTTMTGELLKLSDWLLARGCTHVAMESTGEYWKPVFNILYHFVNCLQQMILSTHLNEGAKGGSDL